MKNVKLNYHDELINETSNHAVGFGENVTDIEQTASCIHNSASKSHVSAVGSAHNSAVPQLTSGISNSDTDVKDCTSDSNNVDSFNSCTDKSKTNNRAKKGECKYTVLIPKIYLGEIVNNYSTVIDTAINYTVAYYSDFQQQEKIEDILEKVTAKDNQVKEEKKASLSKVSRDKIYKSITFRTSEDNMHKLKKIYNTDSNTKVVKCCLEEYSDYLTRLTRSEYDENLGKAEYIASRPGIKTKDVLKALLNSINEIRDKYDSNVYVEGFCGVANTLLHLEKFEIEVVNDAEDNIINLIEVIQKWNEDFLIKLSEFPVNKTTFDSLCKIHDSKPEHRLYKKEKIKRAVVYFYLLLLSYYAKCKHFRKKASPSATKKKFVIFKKIGQRIQNLKIFRNDILYFLDNLSEKAGSSDLDRYVLYLDPPYIYTEYYYTCSSNKKDKTERDSFPHRKLCNKVKKLKCKGVKILISYRATLSYNKKNKKEEDTISQKEQDKLNRTVCDELDKLYKEQDFYVQFIRIPKNKGNRIFDQIEVILSSEPVTGSHPYDRNMYDLIQNYAEYEPPTD